MQSFKLHVNVTEDRESLVYTEPADDYIQLFYKNAFIKVV